jgi:hypothetical protein
MKSNGAMGETKNNVDNKFTSALCGFAIKYKRLVAALITRGLLGPILHAEITGSALSETPREEDR